MRRVDESNSKYIELLMSEAAVIVSAMESTTSRLWQIRAAEITVWVFVLSAGLGQFSDGRVSSVLLLLSVPIPLLFVLLDRRVNRWYIKLRSRSDAISTHLNSDESHETFPLYDPGMRFKASDLPNTFKDINYVIFYGMQVLFSAFVVMFSYLRGLFLLTGCQ